MKHPHPKRDEIINDLLSEVPRKLISHIHKTSLSTVDSIAQRCIDYVPKLKKKLPDPDQLTFKF